MNTMDDHWLYRTTLVICGNLSLIRIDVVSMKNEEIKLIAKNHSDEIEDLKMTIQEQASTSKNQECSATKPSSSIQTPAVTTGGSVNLTRSTTTSPSTSPSPAFWSISQPPNKPTTATTLPTTSSPNSLKH